jgi:Ca2+-transporting ATPase
MLNETGPGALTGLSEEEALSRLEEEGYNELPSSKRRSIVAIAFEVVREPMFLLLVACGAIYLVLGDLQEALMLLGFVFVVMGITLYQECKTERALEALRDLSSPCARVIRDGFVEGELWKAVGNDHLKPGDRAVVQRVEGMALMVTLSDLSAKPEILNTRPVPVDTREE